MNNNINGFLFINKNISKIYSYIYIIALIFIFMIIISFKFNYITYLDINLIYENNELVTYIDEDNIKYLINTNKIKIGNKKYLYTINKIDKEYYIDNNNNYKKVFLNIKIPDKYQINNYIVKGKIEKENKKIIKYLINYFRKE